MLMEILYINLDRDTERNDAMTAQALHMNKKFTRIPGIQGSDLPPDFKNAQTSSVGKLCTDSMIGCFLSHKKAWEYVVSTGTGCVILEDDCVLVPDFEKRAKRVLKNAPEFDIMYFGSFTLPFIPRLVHGTMKGKHYRTPSAPLGLHCYYITVDGARKLLDEFKFIDYHVDLMIILRSSKFIILESKQKLGFQYSTCENSGLNENKFPKTFNEIADGLPSYDNISWSYHLSAPILKIPYLDLNINAWTLMLGLLYYSGYTQEVMMLLVYEFYHANQKDRNLIAKYFVLLV